MSLECLRPALLLLLPVCLAAVWFLRRKNRRISLILRSLLCALCVLALSAPSVRMAGGNSAVWILADASDSARVHQEAMTQAIQTAIDKMSQKGGGTVVIPDGHWLSGRIILKSGVCLHLSDGAVLNMVAWLDGRNVVREF